MSLRQIIVVTSTHTQPKVLRSEAETWGQLKDSLSSEFGDLNKMRVVVRETKATLELPDAILPEGNFTLFLSAKQIKAGNEVDVVKVLERLKDDFTSAIDDIIEDIEDGEFTNDAPVAPSSSSSLISREDQEFFRRLNGGVI